MQFSVTLFDATTRSIEADNCGTAVDLPAAYLAKLGRTTGCRVYCGGIAYDVASDAATLNASIALYAGSFPAFRSYVETEAQVSTIAATWSLGQSLATAATLPAGTYRIEWSVLIGMVAAPRSNARIRIDLDASTDTSSDGTVLLACDFDLYAYGANGIPVAGFRDIALTAGVHTIRIKYSATGGGGNGTYVQNRRLAIERVV